MRFLPGVVAAGAGTARVSALAWGGYDGATRAPMLGATAEARLTSRVVLGAGAVYAPAAYAYPAAIRPSVTVRVQLLDQRRHGFDGTLSWRTSPLARTGRDFLSPKLDLPDAEVC